MLEFASAALWISSAASLTSNSPRSRPPVMLSRMPVAPSTDSSSSGLEIAAFAASDPMTAELASAYFHPLGITSTLDAAIWYGGQFSGVVCHEQIGPSRDWTVEVPIVR